LNNNNENNLEIDTLASFHHPNRDKWEYGFQCMLQVAQSTTRTSKSKKQIDTEIIAAAQYNVGKAYFHGFGVKQSDLMAEKYWLLSAHGDPTNNNDDNSNGCVTAMTTLAFFYSRKGEPEFFNLDKAFYWHNEACGNGSLESQGSLGAIYYFGIGRKIDMEAAYDCLTQSSERGNVYSMGLLSAYYYRNKFFVKAANLSKKITDLYDIEAIAKETKCLKDFIAKGIAMACFIYGRCLDSGRGLKIDKELARKYYKRVCFLFLFLFFCLN
jgi:TPR repeat protein